MAEARPPRVAVIMAMQAEADAVITALDLEPAEVPQAAGPVPFRWFHRAADLRVGPTYHTLVSVNGEDVRHGVPNIGTQPAVLNTWVTARLWQPDLIISAGTAGGWEAKGAAIGDVYLSSEPVVFHDRRIAMPNFDAYGVGSYPVNVEPGLHERLGLKPGTMTTSDSLDETATDREMIAANGGDAKDMEAAAVAWTAELLDVPMLAVKAITDLVDSPVDTAEQFTENLDQAMAALAAKLPALLEALAERAI